MPMLGKEWICIDGHAMDVPQEGGLLIEHAGNQITLSPEEFKAALMAVQSEREYRPTSVLVNGISIATDEYCIRHFKALAEVLRNHRGDSTPNEDLIFSLLHSYSEGTLDRAKLRWLLEEFERQWGMLEVNLKSYARAYRKDLEAAFKEADEEAQASQPQPVRKNAGSQRPRALEAVSEVSA